MEFSQTSLGEEYRLIQEAGYDSYARYETTIITEAGEVQTLSTVSIDWIRDYRNSSADEVHVTVVLELGKYLNQVLPFKENLKVIVSRTPISRRGEEIVGQIKEQTFIAHLPVEDETPSIGGRPETATEETADMVGLKQVSIQLEEEAFSRVRSEMVGGVFRDTRPFDVLMALLNNSNANLDLDLENKIKGISAVAPNNNTKREHVLIPHGTPLVAVANKLQKQFGGIYNCGIGCYLQKGFWYVWPLYNYKRYDEADKTALFIIAPTNRYRGVELTYRMNGNNFVAVITGGHSRIDPSEAKLLNEGNGARYPNTDAIMESFVTTGNNKAVALRNVNASEFTGVTRRGNSMSRVTEDMTQSNAFNEASKLAERNAAFFQLEWENSDPDLIFPGLQCEVAFLVKGVERFISGVVVHAHAYSAIAGTGLHSKNHQITTEVVVMVDRLNPSYQLFIEQSES